MANFETAEEYIEAMQSTEDPKEIIRLWNHASSKADTETGMKLVMQLHKVVGNQVVAAIESVPRDELVDCTVN